MKGTTGIILPKGWRMVKLGEILEVQNGYAFNSKNFVEAGGRPLLRIRDLKNNQTSLCYKGDFDKSYLISKGDLLIGMDGEFKCYRWEGEEALLNQRVCRLQRFNPNRLLPKYLFFLINRYLEQIESQTHYVTVKHLSSKKICVIEIPLPPLPTQRKIIEILDAASALRRKRCEADAKMKELIPAIFAKIFGDPATNPKGWEVKKLGEVCKVRRGASPRPMGDPRYFGGNIPWIRIADIHRQGKYLRETKDHVTEEGAKRSVHLKEGSLIMAMAASIGTPCILKVNGCIHDGFVVFEEYEDVLDQEFFFYFIQAFNREFVRLAPQGTQKNLNTAIIKSVPMILPPMELQKEFARAARAVEEDFELHRKCDGRLEDLFSVLMYKVFCGELVS